MKLLQDYILKQLRDKYTPTYQDYYNEDFILSINFNEKKFFEVNDICDYIEANYDQETINKNCSPIANQIDTESFIKLCDLQVIEQMDAYGTSLFQLYDQEYIIYNTYGDEDDFRNNDRIYTPCILHRKTKIIHVYDILYKNGDYVIHNEAFGNARIDPKNYKGKRAFYYYPDKKTISIKGLKIRKNIKVS